MPGPWWIIAGAVGLLLAAGVAAFIWWRRQRHAAQFLTAQQDFRLKREYLEAKFFELAAGSGKPRGLQWVNCDFEDHVSYARDRASGELTALVGITISFTAVEGGGMEEVEAVGNLRAATAVFHYRNLHWHSEGRAIFNLNPAEAIRHFHASLEGVSPDLPNPSGRVSSKK